MKKDLIKMGLLTLSAVFLIFGGTSCSKEKPTLAEIIVVDTAGNRVPNATVYLFPTPSIPPPAPIILDSTLTTDSNGEVVFDFSDYYNQGQAGFAVLDIHCTSSDLSLYGEGLIRIREEERNTAKVIIQP